MNNFHDLLGMVDASQGKPVPNRVILCQCLLNILPKFTSVAQLVHIANDVKGISGSGQSYIDSVVRLQETNNASLVTSHQRKENNVVLFSLEVIHHTDLHILTDRI